MMTRMMKLILDFACMFVFAENAQQIRLTRRSHRLKLAAVASIEHAQQVDFGVSSRSSCPAIATSTQFSMPNHAKPLTSSGTGANALVKNGNSLNRPSTSSSELSSTSSSSSIRMRLSHSSNNTSSSSSSRTRSRHSIKYPSSSYASSASSTTSAALPLNHIRACAYCAYTCCPVCLSSGHSSPESFANSSSSTSLSIHTNSSSPMVPEVLSSSSTNVQQLLLRPHSSTGSTITQPCHVPEPGRVVCATCSNTHSRRLIWVSADRVVGARAPFALDINLSADEGQQEQLVVAESSLPVQIGAVHLSVQFPEVIIFMLEFMSICNLCVCSRSSSCLCVQSHR